MNSIFSAIPVAAVMFHSLAGAKAARRGGERTDRERIWPRDLAISWWPVRCQRCRDEKSRFCECSWKAFMSGTRPWAARKLIEAVEVTQRPKPTISAAASGAVSADMPRRWGAPHSSRPFRPSLGT